MDQSLNLFFAQIADFTLNTQQISPKCQIAPTLCQQQPCVVKWNLLWLNVQILNRPTNKIIYEPSYKIKHLLQLFTSIHNNPLTYKQNIYLIIRNYLIIRSIRTFNVASGTLLVFTICWFDLQTENDKTAQCRSTNNLKWIARFLF